MLHEYVLLVGDRATVNDAALGDEGRITSFSGIVSMTCKPDCAFIYSSMTSAGGLQDDILARGDCFSRCLIQISGSASSIRERA